VFFFFQILTTFAGTMYYVLHKPSYKIELKVGDQIKTSLVTCLLRAYSDQQRLGTKPPFVSGPVQGILCQKPEA
jgi:hypothetical protein